MSTQRIDDNQNDSQGTQRIDDNQNDNQGTQRIDDSQNDNQGTQRIDSQSDNQGTQRIDNYQANASDTPAQKADDSVSTAVPAVVQSHVAAQGAVVDGNKTGEVFSSGQVVELNGVNYFVEEMISMSSGEAVIYRVSKEGKDYVLKHYKLGYDLPDAVLTKLKNNPKDKLVALYDFGRHFQQNFEVMEYAQGGNLAEYVKEKGAVKDVEKLKNIVGQLNEGLQQLHADHKIIYQDLKPDNIYFRDKAKTSVILADFGISSVMQPGKNEAEVRANATKEYAAPELARVGNNTQVLVDPSVDYFALGITMLYLWIGDNPFHGMTEATRARQILNKEFVFPDDLPAECKILIQGLINPIAKERWGNQYVKKWLSGASLQSDYQKSIISYERKNFDEKTSYASPAELADLMEKDPDRASRYLFSGVITQWLVAANDEYNKIKIDEIIDIVSSDESQKRAAVFAAVYALNPDKPFISHGNKTCESYSEIASALLDEAGHYMKALKNKNDFFYLYILATQGINGPVIVQNYHKYFSEYSPKRALTLIYFNLQDDDGKSISIGSKTYYSPDEIAEETDSNQISLIKKAVQEEDSLLLVWLSACYGDYFESTDEFKSLSASNKFMLLSKFPFLSYKELMPDWKNSALDDLQKLIYNSSGRKDLFEAYLKQELPFTGKFNIKDWNPTAIDYLTECFIDIRLDAKTGCDLINFLHKNGAEVNEPSGNGSYPLTTAVYKRNVPVVKTLLELGASPNNVSNYAPIMWALLPNDSNEKENDRIQIAELLLDYSANVNVEGQGLTPLMQAMSFSSSQKVVLVNRIISAGADVKKRDSDGVNLLGYAVVNYSKRNSDQERNDDLQVIQKLIQSGVKADALNNRGYWSPLMRAADLNCYDAAQQLITGGAKVEFADVDGDTAFVYARKKNLSGNITALLDPGSKLALKNILLSIAKVAIQIAAILWVFLSMDGLARVVSSFNLSHPVLIGASIVLAHLLTAYIGIMLFGVKGYWEKLCGTFSRLTHSLYYVLFIPIVFPLVVALFQFLTRLLPESINTILSYPDQIITKQESSAGMLFVYLLFLAIWVGGIIGFAIITRKFQRVMYNYKDNK